ncbi:Asparagine synthetase domain-containing protein 1 [Blyttiomyces sp. JEL0837]|nr:Asparagine synthetase domain-containing protein 1 [Blyttiomyces sp. JEL0837]
MLIIHPAASDTESLFKAITGPPLNPSNPTTTTPHPSNPIDDPNVDNFATHLTTILSSIHGPWAFLFYHAPSSNFFFGRDHLGRRSLVWHFPSGGCQKVEGTEIGLEKSFVVSSVAELRQSVNDGVGMTKGDDEDENGDDEVEDKVGVDVLERFWNEVPANGIYSLNVGDFRRENLETLYSKLRHYPWLPYSKRQHPSSTSTTESSNFNLIAPAETILNSTLPTPQDLPILTDQDLLLSSTPPNNAHNSQIQKSLPTPPPHLLPIISQFESILSQSVKLRVETIVNCSFSGNDGDNGKTLAVLFSGGLDCMVLVAFAARWLPMEVSIDLLNVGFENPRSAKAAAGIGANASKKGKNKDKKKGGKGLGSGGGGDQNGVDGNNGNDGGENQNTTSTTATGATTASSSKLYEVPDRKTGRKGAIELQALFPDRVFRFVEIDVSYEEAVAARPAVMDLVAPLESVMDLSIAIAFWFATRGKGSFVDRDGIRKPYETTAHVLLSGLGADEQLGGYNRHRSKFLTTFWPGLLSELQKDVSRISKRNLGRDDRIISDHSREVRFPYLAEPVMTFLSGLPVHYKCDPRYARGIGDKLLLRWVADRVGLSRAAVEVKRAVQFGARTAKMEDGKETGEMKVTVKQ